MPGIVTHNKIFKESINHLLKRKNKSFLLRSIKSLFNSDEHMAAGLFGSIGPNIFDYVPKRENSSFYGSNISFFLHDGGFKEILLFMINRINSYKDKNNEWSSTQRAYLYGLISHIVADSIFHPFVFYFSGFPNMYEKSEVNRYREQNLLFQYNLDNYYLYYDENASDFNFNLLEMLPVNGDSRIGKPNSAIKYFILESIEECYPDIYKKIILRGSKNSENKYIDSFGYLDLIPYFIKLTYWIKRNDNRRFNNFLKIIKRNKILYSDFIIQYPGKKKINKDVLNFHKGRWQYPAGRTGFLYDSIDDLMFKANEKIIDIWEMIESNLYGESKFDIANAFNFNAYTGEEKAGYYDMENSNAVKLYF